MIVINKSITGISEGKQHIVIRYKTYKIILKKTPLAQTLEE